RSADRNSNSRGISCNRTSREQRIPLRAHRAFARLPKSAGLAAAARGRTKFIRLSTVVNALPRRLQRKTHGGCDAPRRLGAEAGLSPEAALCVRWATTAAQSAAAWPRPRWPQDTLSPLMSLHHVRTRIV